MEVLLAVVFIALFVFSVALSYKKRVAIAKWLEDPALALSSNPKMRRRQLERRIEDAQFEIELIDEMHSDTQPDKKGGD